MRFDVAAGIEILHVQLPTAHRARRALLLPEGDGAGSRQFVIPAQAGIQLSCW
jgi:hypothetical protein